MRQVRGLRFDDGRPWEQQRCPVDWIGQLFITDYVFVVVASPTYTISQAAPGANRMALPVRGMNNITLYYNQLEVYLGRFTTQWPQPVQNDTGKEKALQKSVARTVRLHLVNSPFVRLEGLWIALSSFRNCGCMNMSCQPTRTILSACSSRATPLACPA